MNNVRLLDITPDFYAFSYSVNQKTGIIISAHGWMNQIKRNNRFLDASDLALLINSWGGDYSRITVASCFSVYLHPSKLKDRLASEGAKIYQDTLSCKLSTYIPGVRVVGFIGEVTSSVDNPQAWAIYNSIDDEFGRGLLEMTLSATFTILFNAIVTANIKNPCRYVEFLNGKLHQQYAPTININNHIFTQL